MPKQRYGPVSAEVEPEFSAVAKTAPGYQEVFDHTQAVQMLLKGRTQLLVLDSATFYRRLTELGADPAQIQSFNILPKVQYRLATQDKLLQQQISKLLQQWRQRGQLQQIRQEARIATTDIVRLLRTHQQ
jgi:ABC-type amino acid transport substrate-binding protein